MKHLRRLIREILKENFYTWDKATKKSLMLDKPGMEKSDRDNVARFLKGLGLLSEAMINPSSLGSDFALHSNYKGEKSGDFWFILYNKEKAIENIKVIKERDREKIKESGFPLSDYVNEHVYEALYNTDDASKHAIVAVLKTTSPEEDCNFAWEVTNSAAEPGYGPTLYDLVMSISPHGIVSDRSSVSSPARKVYQKYALDRDDVQLNYLDDGVITPNYSVDDCKLHSFTGNQRALISMAQTEMFIQWLEDYDDELLFDVERAIQNDGYQDLRSALSNELYPDEVIMQYVDANILVFSKSVMVKEWEAFWREQEKEISAQIPPDEEILKGDESAPLNLSYNLPKGTYSGEYTELSRNHSQFFEFLESEGYETSNFDHDEWRFLVRDFFHDKYQG